MKNILFLVAMLIGSNANASTGYIAKEVVIDRVSATSSREDAFWVWYTTNASDLCNGRVKFQLVNSGTTGTFERAFTLATTAVVSGNKVNLYSYTDPSDCLSAVQIELYR